MTDNNDFSTVPIDIHSSKLLEWLISRRHSDKDWHMRVALIRKMIESALQDMPENEKIVTLLSGTHLNYFHCLQIVDILKETEAESKNLFGRYSSQRMKDWQEIIRLYETNGAYLAEAAQILQQNVAYEIPLAKKQLAKSRSTIEESAKKEVDYLKLSKEAQKQFEVDCVKMGIEGQSIRDELLRLAEKLPAFFTLLVQKCRQLRPAYDYYADFRKFSLKRADKEPDLLAMLRFVADRGELTFYEWRTGEKPERVEGAVAREGKDDVQNDEQAIDFGDAADDDRCADIDFGDDSNVAIETVDISSAEQLESVAASRSSGDTSIARGQDALSILEHRQTQRLLLLDLLELEAFLRGRLFDLRSEHSSDYLIGASIMLLAPKTISTIGADDVERMLADVRYVIDELSDQNRKHLFKIRQSSKFVDMIAAKFHQKRTQVEKFRRSAELMREKQVECKVEIERLQAQLDVFAQKTRDLQKQVEAEISKKYKNRPVNIMGGITAALAAH